MQVRPTWCDAALSATEHSHSYVLLASLSPQVMSVDAYKGHALGSAASMLLAVSVHCLHCLCHLLSALLGNGHACQLAVRRQ